MKEFLKEKKTQKSLIVIACLLVLLVILVVLTSGGKKEDKNNPKGQAQTSTSDKSDGKDDEETNDKNSGDKASDEKDSGNDADDSDDNTSGDLYAEVTVTGGWGENPVFTQLSINIINKTSDNIDGWTVTVNVGEGAEVDSGWNANYSIEDGILTATNVDYNSIVYAGGNTEIGLILKNVTGDLSATLESNGIYVETNYNNNNNNGNNSDNNNNNGGNWGQAVSANALEVPEPTTDDWLYTDGSKIYDSEGKQVWLTGVNWFGYNTGTNTFDGLWACDLNSSLQGIANHGFNLLRVPISAELILDWKEGTYPDANFNQATNSYLVGMNSLEIFDYVVGQCRANGIKIMIDIHSAETNASGHTVNLWKTSNVTTEEYQEALVWMAARYAKDDTIIAYDLKNEPHGKPYEGSEAAIWNDSKSDNNWKYVAEQTALKVLKENPNVLIMVEGTEIYPIDIKKNGDYKSTDDKDYYFNWWGGNLRGVADYPVDLGDYQNKLVYSPHDYGPTVYEQPWFTGSYDFDSLMEDCWGDNWFYIHEKNIAPLLIGEWGGYMTEPNITWMTYMRQLISENHLNHTFWCFNSNSGDTGGLVKDDFVTWDDEKYEFVKEVLWQEDGKFVGLDHEIALGTDGNGINLSDAKGLK